jgi:hypothetical protein
MTIDTVRRYRLDPAGEDRLLTSALARGRVRPLSQRAFRVVRPGTSAPNGERVVERVQDGWRREWALVLGRAVRRS